MPMIITFLREQYNQNIVQQAIGYQLYCLLQVSTTCSLIIVSCSSRIERISSPESQAQRLEKLGARDGDIAIALSLAK